MEHQLWKAIVSLLSCLSKPVFDGRLTFTDDRIIEVYYWAVIHDRSVSWACKRHNWPICLRKKMLPCQSQMSRRLRSKRILSRLAELEKRVLRPGSQSLYWMIDGKPLVIGGCSKDKQAGYGRAASSKAKGYKLHALVNTAKNVAIWRVAPMNADERKMARRMLRDAEIQGYVVGDSNYDSNQLHELCDRRGNLQLVVPRRYGPNRGHGHRKQTTGRMRSKEILENPFADFGTQLLKQRSSIERQFGNLTSWGGGLTHLPPWVRTHRRVKLYVQAKLIINTAKQLIKSILTATHA